MTKKHKSEHQEKHPEIAHEHDKGKEELKNQLLRALADFDNFRKRLAVEKEELLKYGNENLVKELLPSLDGISKAVEFGKNAHSEEMLNGISMVKKMTEEALYKFGVKPVDAVGKKFDPNFHQAILMKESDGEPGIVIEESQKGYTINGRLIRPSMVIVSK